MDRGTQWPASSYSATFKTRRNLVSKYKVMLDMVVQAFNTSPWEKARQVDLCEIRASLVHIVTMSRWAGIRETLSKKKNKVQKT